MEVMIIVALFKNYNKQFCLLVLFVGGIVCHFRIGLAAKMVVRCVTVRSRSG